MGCMHNSFASACRDVEFKQCIIQFTAMKMSLPDIRTLFHEFNLMDVDGSGSIGLPELLAHINLPRTVFTEKIFSIFDEDKSGEINFKEFVMALWNFCSLTNATFDIFAFNLYDTDGGGSLSPDEVHAMLSDVFGKHEMKNNAQAKIVAAELKAMEDRMETFNARKFRVYMKSHSGMLFPAFQIQQALQSKFLGIPYWEKTADIRIKFCKGKYVSIDKFLLSHADRMPLSSNGTVQEYDGPFSKEDLAQAKAAGYRSTPGPNHYQHHLDMKAHAQDVALARPSFGMSFGASAKQQWAASVLTVSNALSGKHHKKKGNHRKVYITATSATRLSNNPHTDSEHENHSHSQHKHNWNNDHAGLVLNQNGTLTLTPSQTPRDSAARQSLSDFVPRRSSRGSREHSFSDAGGGGGGGADWGNSSAGGNRSHNNSFSYSVDHSMNDMSMNFEDWHNTSSQHGGGGGVVSLSRNPSSHSLTGGPRQDHHGHHSRRDHSDKDKKHHLNSHSNRSSLSGHHHHHHTSDKDKNHHHSSHSNRGAHSSHGHSSGENSPERPRLTSNVSADHL